MSDPYLRCEACDLDYCLHTVEKARDRYKAALQEIRAATVKLLGDEDGGHEQALLEFVLSMSEKVHTALAVS